MQRQRVVKLPPIFKMVKLDRHTWKREYFKRIEVLVGEFQKCLVIGIDNIQSKQLQQIRHALRGNAEILCGKNTLIRRAFRDLVEKYPVLEELLEHVRGNVGFVFTNMDLGDCRDILEANQIQAPAKAGTFAQADVFIEEGPTGMSPEKTSFFQAVDIPTKIAKGTIAILNRYRVCEAGEKVGLSEAKLLTMLGINPFFYGVVLKQVMEAGSVFPPAVLDTKPEEFLGKILGGLSNIASISLQIGYVNKASAPHLVVNGFKNILSICLATDIAPGKPTPGYETAKLWVTDPEAFAAANPGGGGGGGGAAAPAAAAEAPKAAAKVESEEGSDESMGGLFD